MSRLRSTTTSRPPDERDPFDLGLTRHLKSSSGSQQDHAAVRGVEDNHGDLPVRLV
jgi:hypothetical protein